MAKKKTDYSITINTSISNRRHFITQRDCADWLGIKNCSKQAIRSRVNKLSWEVEFRD